MSNRRESIYPNDWLEKAEKDLKRAQDRLKEKDLEEAAFHLQQAVEKYLKGYLLMKGWKLKRIHDLEFLLDEAVKFHPKLEKFRSLCQEITGYYLTERYPFLKEEPSHAEIETNLKKALELISTLKGDIKIC